jgi:hypothetical protein
MAGRRTFRMHTDYQPAVRQTKEYSNPLGFPNVCAVGFINKNGYIWNNNILQYKCLEVCMSRNFGILPRQH